MSREILFKAFDTRIKKWCYDGVGFTIFGEVLLIDGFNSHFRENPATDETGSYLGSLERISDIALLQFTGRLDKNGKEIYDGDIIGIELIDGIHPAWVVEWHDKSAQWRARDKNRQKASLTAPGFWGTHAVLGSVYANPELLK